MYTLATSNSQYENTAGQKYFLTDKMKHALFCSDVDYLRQK